MLQHAMEVLQEARLRLGKDGKLTPKALAHKVARYTFARGTSSLHLRGADHVGERARTQGRPRIDNLGYMTLGDDVQLRSVMVPVELATGPQGRLTIGSRVNINYGTSIGCLEAITIGNRVRIGTFVLIIDSDFHDLHQRDLRPPPKPVTIEDDVWIGSKASILPGVTVGRGAVVGTCAVVTKDVPPFTIVAGVPAQKVGDVDPERFIPEGKNS